MAFKLLTTCVRRRACVYVCVRNFRQHQNQPNGAEPSRLEQSFFPLPHPSRQTSHKSRTNRDSRTVFPSFFSCFFFSTFLSAFQRPELFAMGIVTVRVAPQQWLPADDLWPAPGSSPGRATVVRRCCRRRRSIAIFTNTLCAPVMAVLANQFTGREY